MSIFKYGEEEINYLSKKDKKMASAIKRHGIIERVITKDIFKALVNSIVSQQISSKAAKTVFKKLELLAKTITVENIKKLKTEDIQKCGMSFRKAEYVKNAAESDIEYKKLKKLSDEEIIKTITKLNGVGVWTAEMLMLFSLERKDILSFKDLAIINGIKKLYGLEIVTKEYFESLRKTYSPYGSVASIYLWAVAKE